MSDHLISTQVNSHWLADKPGIRKFCWIALGLAFIGTALSMFLPFISIDKPFKRPAPYSIIQTISLMWNKELYLLAIIIAGFSAIFPFLKLMSMANILYQIEINNFRLKTLHIASRLGKWSMVDVFIVSILLGIGENQFVFKVFTHFGLYLFTFSILLSIGMGIFLSTLAHQHKGEHIKTPDDYGHGHNALSIIILSVASVAFISLCGVPFLEIDDWKLRDRNFTLLTFIGAIWNQDAPLLAIYFWIALLLLPFLEIASLWFLISKTGARLFDNRLAPAFSLMRHWSTLDVFLIALMIFVVEGEQFIRFHINLGFWLLAVTLIAYSSRYIIRYQITKRYQASEHDERLQESAESPE